MDRLKTLITEAHRRSLWQVLLIYVGAGWIVFEIVQTVTEGLGLPHWFPAFAALLLLIGLPVVLATAFVREGGPAGAASDPTLLPVEASGSAAARRRRVLTWRNAGLSFMAALAVWGLVATGWLLFGGESATPGVSEERPSLAALPFVNRSGLKEDAYFTDGIHDEILTHLYKISGLSVRGRTSVMQYRDTEKSLQQIGEELNARYILEGGVQRAGGTVRINFQLIDAESDEHVWAETYDRRLTVENLLSIQSEVARRVAETLRAALTEEEAERIERRPTDNLEAYDHFLTGTEYLRSGPRRDLTIAEEELEKAVELDPGFALAHAKLSKAHMAIWYGPEWPNEERLARVREAAERALELDDGLAEAHLAMGDYFYRGVFDYDRAEQHFRAAQRLSPGDGEVYNSLGVLARRRGQAQESVAYLERAVELAPRDVGYWNNLATSYCYTGQYSEANTSYDRAIALAPDRSFAYYWKAFCLLDQPGGRERAWEAVLKMREKTNLTFLGGDQYRNRALLRILPEEYLVFRGRHLREHTLESSGAERPFGYFLFKAVYFDLVGEPEQSRAYYDSARVELEELVEAEPNSPFYHANLGIAYAGVDRVTDAVREGILGRELTPIATDLTQGPARVAALAEIYVMVGKYDEAVDQLELLLSHPNYIRAGWLRLDPIWDPLRDDPRFQALLDKYDQPAR